MMVARKTAKTKPKADDEVIEVTPLVEPEPPEIESNSVREETNMAVEDKGGHAVVTVDVPAHKKEVSVAHSQIEGCAVAAVEAWNIVKGADDAAFTEMAGSFRDDLMYAAEGVFRSGKAMDGDTSLARFEREVLRIKIEQAKAKEAAKKAAKAA